MAASGKLPLTRFVPGSSLGWGDGERETTARSYGCGPACGRTALRSEQSAGAPRTRLLAQPQTCGALRSIRRTCSSLGLPKSLGRLPPSPPPGPRPQVAHGRARGAYPHHRTTIDRGWNMDRRAILSADGRLAPHRRPLGDERTTFTTRCQLVLFGNNTRTSER